MGPATIQTPPSRCHTKKQAAMLEREFLSCPVTALAFLHDPASTQGEGPGTYLLAGEDTQLKVYDARTGLLCGELRAFESSVVHGISVAAGAEHVLLWGGASVAVIPGRVLRAVTKGCGGGEECRDDDWCPNEATAPDWIYDGILDSGGGGCPARGVLVTAHNEIVPFRLLGGPVDGRGSPSVSFGAVISPSRPILYSANVCWLGSAGGLSAKDDGDEVLVAGGTVFGEIIVWKCRPWDESGGGGGATEVLCVLSGHEGSVFGVTISEELTLPGRGDGACGEKVRLLASCSDDRTVRIWDITGRAGVMPARRAGKLLAESRETGFGGDATEHYDGPQTGSAKDGAANPKELPLKALAVAMGHQSRIWHVRFSTRGLLSPAPKGDCGEDQEPSSRLTVYSFGEDATTQEWLLTLDHVEGTTDVSGALSHVNTVPCHGGKHIWSTAMLGRDDGGEPLIATGGADGKIALLGTTAALAYAASPVESAPTSPDVVDVSFAFSDVSPLIEARSTTAHKAKGETFKTFAFVSESDILVTSTFGSVFIGHVQDDDDSRVSWTGLELPDEVQSDLRGYNIVRGPARNQSGLCFLGSASGAVYMFLSSPRSRLEKITGLGRKVSDIFVLPALPQASSGSSAHASDAHAHLIVTLLGHDEAFSITIARPGSSTSVAGAVATATQSIPLPSGCVITAVDFSGGLLSLGSRDGRLLFFRNRLHGKARDDAGGAWERIHSSPEITRSKDAITSIVRLPGTASGDVSPYVLATCRDGKYLIYEMEIRTDGGCGGETISLDLVHDSSPPFGPVITEAWFEEGEEEGRAELMLCGFRSRFFVVWNESRQHEVATVDCGGVHRTYAYVTRRRDAARQGADGAPRRQQEWIRFAYSKAQRTHMYTQQGAGHTALRTGTHGREIRAASWCDVAAAAVDDPVASEEGRLLATAAEDTTVRIWRYEVTAGRDGGGVSRALRCAASLSAHTAGLQSLRWCGSGGRRRYLVSSAGNEELFIWRVSRLDGRSRYGGLAVVREAAYPDRTADGDLRILSVDTSEEGSGGGGGGFVVSLVLSNSEVKTYRYSRELGFLLLARGMYTGGCLTQIHHLRVRHAGGLGLRVLTASTDGSVVVWEAKRSGGSAPAEYAIRSVHGLHQSSIKGLDVWMVPAAGGGAAWVVLTAGDDNALGILQLREDDATDAADNRPQHRRAIVRSAHAAGITGIRTIKSALPDEVLAATISNDQRVKLWRVRGLGTEREKGLKVELVQDKYSAVADAGDLALSPDGKLVVAGVGMEVWGMHLGENDG
ncbi:hypothetical protein RB595_005582 [Gaeumannomyces hyphopodioides]